MLKLQKHVAMYLVVKSEEWENAPVPQWSEAKVNILAQRSPPPETKERATDKVNRYKSSFRPVCQDLTELESAIEEVEKKIREHPWPQDE